ncbi:MAG: four helix bundle protein [Balneola sp.]|nr:four helix bundle protein [Balneola sp.]MBE78242.1 four helix bundle protein [Balneola sp.]
MTNDDGIVPSSFLYISTMPFKFEKLEVWQLSIDLSAKVYSLIENMPKSEQFNLSSQIRRAVTSISLNIAEGSTGQSDPEQTRFIGYAHRSLMEVVACLMLMKDRNYLDQSSYDNLYADTEKLSAKLLAMKNYLRRNSSVSEEGESYNFEDESDIGQ